MILRKEAKCTSLSASGNRRTNMRQPVISLFNFLEKRHGPVMHREGVASMVKPKTGTSSPGQIQPSGREDGSNTASTST